MGTRRIGKRHQEVEMSTHVWNKITVLPFNTYIKRHIKDLHVENKF